MGDAELNGNHTYMDAIIDAAIAAGSAFFGALTGIAILNLRTDPSTYLLAASIAAGIAFFGSMGASVKRPVVSASPPPSP